MLPTATTPDLAFARGDVAPRVLPASTKFLVPAVLVYVPGDSSKYEPVEDCPRLLGRFPSGFVVVVEEDEFSEAEFPDESDLAWRDEGAKLSERICTCLVKSDGVCTTFDKARFSPSPISNFPTTE